VGLLLRGGREEGKVRVERLREGREGRGEKGRRSGMRGPQAGRYQGPPHLQKTGLCCRSWYSYRGPHWARIQYSRIGTICFLAVWHKR